MLIDISTPYSFSESLYWLAKYFWGPSKKFAGIVEAIPSPAAINDAIKPEFTLTFLGDIMPLKNRALSVSPELREFISESDYLVANFEGTITERPKRALFAPSDQRHDNEIISQLEKRRIVKVRWLRNARVDPDEIARRTGAVLVDARGRTMILEKRRHR